MSHEIFLIIAATLAAAIIVLLVIFGTSRFRRFLDVSRGAAAAWFFLALVASVATGVFRYIQVEQLARDSSSSIPGLGWTTYPSYSHRPAWALGIPVFCSGLLVALAIPFVVKLYLKWIGGKVTEAEKRPGIEGVRAWLQGGNLPCAILIAVGGWLGFGFSFWSLVALTLMALVAYPLLNSAFAAPEPGKASAPDASVERERVLKMLDDGKITAPESAELLNALSVAQTPRPPQSEPFTSQQKMMLAGLVLLLIGFFLPWFSYNPGQEMTRVMGEMKQSMAQAMPSSRELNVSFPASLKTGSVNIAGGEIRYGLGWFVLLLGIVAAALPYFASNLSPQNRTKATLIGLSLGALILVYLLTQNMRFVSVGILLALAGYVLQFLGTLKEKQLRLA